MTGLEILKKKVQELETSYAELLAGGATRQELYKIWTRIKALEKKIGLIESTQNNSANNMIK